MDVSASDLAEGLADLWQDDILCDITLQTEGTNVRAHRAILAASSKYFRAMFGGNFKEAKEDVVSLDKLGIPSEGLSVIINSLYSLKLDINKENFDLVTMTAILLQFTKIMPLCEEFIQNNLDTRNCIQILQFCETFGLDSLKNKVDLFLLKNFISVSEENSDFGGIDKDCLLEYISDDRLCTDGNEIDVYRAVMKWVKFNPTRNGHVTELLEHIRFHLIPADTITDEIAKDPLLKDNDTCIQWLKKAIDYHLSPYKQPFLQISSRRGELAILMLDGTAANHSWALMSFEGDSDYDYDKVNDRVAVVKPHPLPGLNFYSDVIPFSVENFVYLLYTDQEAAKWHHVRYDPVSDKWLNLAPPPYDGIFPRNFMSAALRESLFICGGFISVPGDEDASVSSGLTACYMYSFEQNTWEHTSDLPQALFTGLSCVHNECVYITSCYNMERQLENILPEDLQLLMYDSSNRLWQEKATPLHFHFDGIFAAVDDNLYIAGGYDAGELGNNYQMTAEVYDINLDQWTDLLIHHPKLDMKLLCEIEHVRCFVMAKALYCFGTIFRDEDDELDGDDLPNSESVAFIFDTETGEVGFNIFWEPSIMDVMELVIIPTERFKRLESEAM